MHSLGKLYSKQTENRVNLGTFTLQSSSSYIWHVFPLCTTACLCPCCWQ